MRDALAGAPRPIAIAHRAGNSLTQLRTAERGGVDFVEADVWLHHGRLEVRHLKSLSPLPVLWDRWKLAPAWRPRLHLDALLAALAAGTGLMLDLKGREPRLPEALVAAVRDAGRPVLVCGQNWRMVDACAAGGITVVHSVGTAGQLAALQPHLDGHEGHAISVQRRLLDREVVRGLKERASAVVTWPVNDDATLRQVLGWGVDGVTSDNLELLRRLVAGRAGPAA
ncbi:MAG: glycerophosphodiester phosphodiesterase [Dehalococcoidia bacterium]